jgi:CBS domain-containing protein
VLGDPRRAFDSKGLPDAVLQARVGETMTRDPRTLAQDDGIGAALEVLLSDRVGALPVVDSNGRLRGIVSYVDLLRYFAER